MNFYKRFGITLFKNHFFLLLFLWALVQGYLIWHNGIVTDLEAAKYIDEANHFLKFGNLNTNNHYLYFTQIFLIAAAIKLHLGYAVIVVIQLLLNLLSNTMIYS